jgi:DNA-binding ferritin-like protein
MDTLATILRSAQFYAHSAHNLAHGQTFHQDHEFLGELYAAYESSYDDVIERCIGTGETIDLDKITLEAAKEIQGCSNETVDKCYDCLLSYELEICAAAVKANAQASLGTQNLLQGICDQSEMRQYKIQQRLKN